MSSGRCWTDGSAVHPEDGARCGRSCGGLAALGRGGRGAAQANRPDGRPRRAGCHRLVGGGSRAARGGLGLPFPASTALVAGVCAHLLRGPLGDLWRRIARRDAGVVPRWVPNHRPGLDALAELQPMDWLGNSHGRRGRGGCGSRDRPGAVAGRAAARGSRVREARPRGVRRSPTSSAWPSRRTGLASRPSSCRGDARGGAHAAVHDLHVAIGTWPRDQRCGRSGARVAGWTAILRTSSADLKTRRRPQDAAPPAESCRRCGGTMRDRARCARMALCPVPVVPLCIQCRLTFRSPCGAVGPGSRAHMCAQADHTRWVAAQVGGASGMRARAHNADISCV